MPSVLHRDPSWLARRSPGFQLFAHNDSHAPQTPDTHSNGPLRKIAHRGTEVFVAAGNELRWGDLSILKQKGEEGHDNEEQAYRVLKTSVSRPLQQLSVSPSGELLVIATSHTCHVALLPASSHLLSGDTTPLRLKTFQVGPTAHVLEQSPLVSTLWHPLSPSRNCLVTITEDACVRLWELDRDNRSTFDEPSLAIDLKKLANATSTQADFSASKYGTSKGFSPDDVEMQVAAACFGGQGSDDESGWSAMTLWVAMSEGDVYALCPFLPSKWRAASTLLPSLSTSVVGTMRAVSQDAEATEAEKRVGDQQCRWLADLDNQDPVLLPGGSEFEVVEVYNRPERPGPVPKLQGPFYWTTPEVELGEVTDIHVIAPILDDDAAVDEYDDYEESPEGLSVSIICLATSTSKIHVCLDLDGVGAEWLPSKRSRTFSPDDEDDKDLLLFETIDLADSSSGDVALEGWPTFTASPTNRYEVLVTTPSGVSTLDFTSWTTLLEDEVASTTDSGIDFRLSNLLSSASTTVSQLIRLPADPQQGVNTAISVYDPSDIGYLLLTSAMNGPFSAILDIPIQLAHPYAPDTAAMAGSLPAPEPRAAYQPDQRFFESSALPQLIKAATEKRLLGSGAGLKGQVKFSPETLQLMADAHRILSAETDRLGRAASDLFLRCERMRAELRAQLQRADELVQRVDNIIYQEDEEGGDEEDGATGVQTREKVEKRTMAVEQKTRELNERVEGLRRKMGRGGGKAMSAKERAFGVELEKLQASIGESGSEVHEAPTEPSAILHIPNWPTQLKEQHSHSHSHGRDEGSLAARFEVVRALHERLLEQAAKAAERSGDDGGKGERQASRPASDFRRRKMVQVQALLERESALIEGVGERLGRLSAGS